MSLRLHHRILQRGYLAYGRLRRGMTLGVRAMLLRGDQVVLVQHSYVPGWYFPGGGVEAGETFADALEREVREETGAALTAPAQLFALYRNSHADKRDHVALFVCRDWEQREPLDRQNKEIVAARLFSLHALPPDITAGTRRRISEVLSGASPAADW